MKKMKRQPIHPGKIIKEDYLKPLSLTITEMATTLGVSRKTLSKILNERGTVTPDMALRLSTETNNVDVGPRRLVLFDEPRRPASGVN